MTSSEHPNPAESRLTVDGNIVSPGIKASAVASSITASAAVGHISATNVLPPVDPAAETDDSAHRE
ncbi:MAG: hypothetical protein K0R62_8548 [Nonomuraea muscovyensis]|nr:hypothetical protein [Nonomuraea muscovyensis]